MTCPAMTYYVNNRITSHIRKALLALLTAVFGVAQTAVPVASAVNAIPRPAIVTDLSVHPDSGAIVIDSEEKELEAERPKTLKTIYMDSTSYTSRVEECDADPFITADGSDVGDGVVATNVLPFGTKVRLPTVFGDKIFTVHDRMNARYSYRLDVWTKELKTARAYGVKRNIPIEVVEYGNNKTQWGARAEKMKQARAATKRVQAIALGK